MRQWVDWRTGADAAKRRQLMLKLADRLGRETGRMRFLDYLVAVPPSRRPDLSRWHDADLAACWIGHATMLLRVGGRTILTDPVFHPRVGVGLLLATVGPLRRQQPALPIAKLPKIDLILLSHAHFDHLDRPSLHALSRRFPGTPIVCAKGTRDLVEDLAFGPVTELAWGEAATVAGVNVSAVPVQHWGPRVFYDNWRTYNAYLLEADNHRVLFGGDTADTDTFRAVAPVDLLCVGIGAYDPYIAAHATPEQAWAMAALAEARYVAAMHHSTFRLSHEPMDEPLRRLLAAAGDEASRIIIRHVGDAWFSRTSAPSPSSRAQGEGR